MAPKTQSWPPLPRAGFVRYRAATPADVSAGRAAFTLQQGPGVRPEPIPILIPQYAVHVDADKGTRTPGILVQAEAAAGTRVVGTQTIPEGRMLVGSLEEFELLGEHPEGPPG